MFEFTHKSFSEYLTARRIVHLSISITNNFEIDYNESDFDIDKIKRKELNAWIYLLGKNEAFYLGEAVDYKRLRDGDRGPNTGGMGCYTPVPWIDDNVRTLISNEVVDKLDKYFASKGEQYTGFLYVGAMITAEGPKILEFNVRMGDPETQALFAAVMSFWFGQRALAKARGQ